MALRRSFLLRPAVATVACNLVGADAAVAGNKCWTGWQLGGAAIWHVDGVPYRTHGPSITTPTCTHMCTQQTPFVGCGIHDLCAEHLVYAVACWAVQV
jgi:hypothetical protein